MNEYDSDKIADLMQTEEDFVLVDNEKDADLLVLNTCSIREKAQEKVFHQIGRWRKIKDVKPDIKIAIGGCVASQEGENIIKRAPAVDIVFGPQTLHKLPSLYKKKIRLYLPKLISHFQNLKSLNQCPLLRLQKHLRLFQLLKDVINIVRFVWFLIPAGMKFLEV